MPEKDNDEISDDTSAEVISNQDVIEELTREEEEPQKSDEEIQAALV